MHLVIPFAAPLSDAGRAALAPMRWAHLPALLAGRDAERDEGDEFSLSPPHERALARAWGWAGSDGQLPFAAWQAAADGMPPDDLAWGLLTPVHWHLGTDQVSQAVPGTLVLDEAASRGFFDVVAPLFTSEGFLMHWGAPERWYLAHESLAELPTASLDRVAGRNVDRWLPSARYKPGAPQARLLRRLLNEAQMLLHEHPLNNTREAQGLPVLNALWLSGCGLAQACRSLELQVETRLRGPALAEDWPAWAKAWALIDEALPSQALTRLTLCGERSALSFEISARGAWQRLRARWARDDIAQRLESL